MILNRKNLINEIEKKKIQRNKRKEKLINELDKIGVEFREDSILTDSYINGSTKYKLNYVVERMAQVKYLYEYCHMEECYNFIYKKQREERKTGFRSDIPVFDEAEEYALDKYSDGRYPDAFPWQQHL